MIGCGLGKGEEEKEDAPPMYGFAAVSSEPRPLPIMKMHTQKPANEWLMMAGMASSAPTPYRNRPQMKTAR